MKHPLEHSFLALLGQYKAVVYKIARLYASTAEDRKDLFQEIVINLWKAYPAFKGNAKVSTWIYQVGLNTAITNYRRKKREIAYEHIHLSITELFQKPVAGGEADQLKVLYRAIENLNKVDKAIILLYLEEKSYKEISEIMGITVANVGMKLMRIKEKLAQKVTKANL